MKILANMKKSLKNLKIIVPFLLVLLFSNDAFCQEPTLSDMITGNWKGRLEFGSAKLTLVLKITLTQDNIMKAWLDSPDQGAKDIEVTSITVNGDSLIFYSAPVRGRYQGQWDKASQAINGIWNQSGMDIPLVMVKTDSVPEYKRPQEPKPPFPYKSEEISFTNQNGKIRLAGTLTLPEGKGPFPACILVSGSGPQNRDEELLGHKPFMVIADYLTRKGYAVLRYDDRGIGASGGTYHTATTLDMATDAKAAFDFLRNDERLISSKIGFIGHSEGGIIASVVATQNLATSFIILLAGPSVVGEEIILAQQELISKAAGVDEKEIKSGLQLNKEIYSVIKKTKDTLQAAQKLTEILNRESSSLGTLNRMDEKTRAVFISEQVKSVNSPWFRAFLTLDPSQYLEQVRCPVLAFYGEKDLQVPPSVNVKPLKKALAKAGNSDYEVLELAGLNHLFQKSATGLPGEYGQLEETFSPKVLEIISAWLALKTK
jgi:pimeloyl-ACP methyl ester carboxylesterase